MHSLAGLYDNRMGPSVRRELCGTCNSGSNDCTGHFGHIELMMNVYNPFFMKNAATILKSICTKCHRLQLSDRMKEIVELQLQLIDAGYVSEASELEEQKMIFCNASKLSARSKQDDDDDDAEKTIEKREKSFTKTMKKLRKLLQTDPINHYGKTKTSESLRNSIIHSTFGAASGSMINKCIHCQRPWRKIRYAYKKFVMNLTKSELEEMKNEASVGNEEENTQKSTMKIIMATECREILQKVFESDGEFLKIVFPILQSSSKGGSPYDVFFMDVLPVVPPNFRPPNCVRDVLVEHPQTKAYHNVVEFNNELICILGTKKSMEGNEEVNIPEDLKEEAQNVFKLSRGATANEKIYFKWEQLQTAIDMILDKDANISKYSSDNTVGIKQLFEKKQGLIRMNMMGKRVNYACRTVITPDPYIEVDAIGIPEAFALKLTYPVPVTPWNVTQLRKMVLNGPDQHPGACYIETSNGSKRIIPKEFKKREAMASTLLKPEKNEGIKFVHRHLLNGDVMLLNRQPTLHRPSIMAHKARILKGEKTFKLHYSNCKSYNADFDGDEMNAHFPQNEVGRSEAYNLVGVPHHYLVPKDGTPLGGLIQDHMISGVKMSMRGRFFSKADYQQLVFQGLNNKTGKIKSLLPTILKPQMLWSGKQVFSTLLLNIIPEEKLPLNLTSTAKVGANLWQTETRRKWKHGGTELNGNEMSEAEVLIRNGELLVGVLDKNHYGSTPYSLIHCMYELYGGEVSSKLLSAFTRVFTTFLQWEGFTLGVKDILVMADADKKRTEIIENSRKVGKSVTCQVLNCSEEISNEELCEKIEAAYANDPKFRTNLDRKYKSAIDVFTNDINKTCLPAGLICKFPSNNLQLMVTSGAKGSTVNTMQISCLLGQIELEGKRPPVMINGKSLPSFLLSDCSPKSGGFIDGRFMTGIEPQGFFFHCMAGREGLIDTAVKTSRSGYLQRCLIKHLEGLTVSYDGTVRDSDRSVVQFMYGEDGMDILKSPFLKLKQMPFLVENLNVIKDDDIVARLQNEPDIDENLRKHIKKIKTFKKKFGSTTQRPVRDRALKKCPPTVTSKFSPHITFGALSECAEDILEKYFKSNQFADKENIRDMFSLKSMQSLAEPGEPVGLLAAQSIGEPSTQMTLNTFHFAGRGDMNVTLGIPRLREILMMASKFIKTPSMEIPFLNQNSENLDKIADKFRIRLNQVTLAEVLSYVNVKSYVSLTPHRTRNYEFTFNFLPHHVYKKQFMVKPKRIIKYAHEEFLIRLFRLIEKASKDVGGDYVEKEQKEKQTASKKKSEEEDELDGQQVDAVLKDLNTNEMGSDDDIDDAAMDDDDATADKRKAKQVDECDYDEPEEKEDGASDSDSDLERVDLSKIKIEIDDAFDVSKLEQLVAGDSNADLEQIKNLEQKETEELRDVQDDEDVAKFLQKKASHSCSSITVKDFTKDKKKHSWFCVKFEVPVKFKVIDMKSVIRDVARSSVIWEVPKIKRAITFKQNDMLCIKTDGINVEVSSFHVISKRTVFNRTIIDYFLQAMLQYDKILDLNKLYTNDIHGVAHSYGIEAAAQVIVKEVQNVFKVYGITVDPRHLSLIADYMTFDGTIKPLNRKGIESSASTFQQVSFESALSFLKNAAMQGRMDNIDSPSACLITGHPCKVGTGTFGLINDLSYAIK
jgi:DNA-directed RNA polymerase I subunit RPA1